MESIIGFFNAYDVIINAAATILLGITAVVISTRYSKKAERLNNDQIFYQLYSKFNERYDHLNATLHQIKSLNQEDFTLSKLKEEATYYKAAVDFFNICAEEHYWHDKNRIDKNVWAAWHYGMNYWYKEIPALRELWKEEIAGEKYKSYYLKRGDNLFDEV